MRLHNPFEREHVLMETSPSSWLIVRYILTLRVYVQDIKQLSMSIISNKVVHVFVMCEYIPLIKKWRKIPLKKKS